MSTSRLSAVKSLRGGEEELGATTKSILHGNGRSETCCVGYADVEKKTPIAMDSLFMQ